jgi:hypothetical protein
MAAPRRAELSTYDLKQAARPARGRAACISKRLLPHRRAVERQEPKHEPGQHQPFRMIAGAPAKTSVPQDRGPFADKSAFAPAQTLRRPDRSRGRQSQNLRCKGRTNDSDFSENELHMFGKARPAPPVCASHAAREARRSHARQKTRAELVRQICHGFAATNGPGTCFCFRESIF